MTELAGVIRRRILLNYRVDPEVLRPALPAGLTLRLVGGWAIAGICLIRLERMRPAAPPVRVGFASDSVAYRAGVSGPDGAAVFIAHRDTSSRFQALARGRLFPARFGHVSFDADDDGQTIAIDVHSAGRTGDIRLRATAADAFARSSAFADLATASRWFEAGAVGYTCRPDGGLDGVELRTEHWDVAPLDVDELWSAWFARFPVGSVEFDSALVMRNVAHRWRTVRASAPPSPGA